MRRELAFIDGALKGCGCCPGHDTWPNEVYKNRRSIRARARDIKREHRYVRRVLKGRLRNNMKLEVA
jgi:hypothetical protein